jgi:hypothetical protein
MAEVTTKPMQDRFVSTSVGSETSPQPVKSTKTAEATAPIGGEVIVPTGGVAPAAPAK